MRPPPSPLPKPNHRRNVKQRANAPLYAVAGTPGGGLPPGRQLVTFDDTPELLGTPLGKKKRRKRRPSLLKNKKKGGGWGSRDGKHTSDGSSKRGRDGKKRPKSGNKRRPSAFEIESGVAAPFLPVGASNYEAAVGASNYEDRDALLAKNAAADEEAMRIEREKKEALLAQEVPPRNISMSMMYSIAFPIKLLVAMVNFSTVTKLPAAVMAEGVVFQPIIWSGLCIPMSNIFRVLSFKLLSVKDLSPLEIESKRRFYVSAGFWSWMIFAILSLLLPIHHLFRDDDFDKKKCLITMAEYGIIAMGAGVQLYLEKYIQILLTDEAMSRMKTVLDAIHDACRVFTLAFTILLMKFLRVKSESKYLIAYTFVVHFLSQLMFLGIYYKYLKMHKMNHRITNTFYFRESLSWAVTGVGPACMRLWHEILDTRFQADYIIGEWIVKETSRILAARFCTRAELHYYSLALLIYGYIHNFLHKPFGECALAEYNKAPSITRASEQLAYYFFQYLHLITIPVFLVWMPYWTTIVKIVLSQTHVSEFLSELGHGVFYALGIMVAIEGLHAVYTMFYQSRCTISDMKEKRDLGTAFLPFLVITLFEFFGVMLIDMLTPRVISLACKDKNEAGHLDDVTRTLCHGTMDFINAIYNPFKETLSVPAMCLIFDAQLWIYRMYAIGKWYKRTTRGQKSIYPRALWADMDPVYMKEIMKTVKEFAVFWVVFWILRMIPMFNAETEHVDHQMRHGSWLATLAGVLIYLMLYRWAYVVVLAVFIVRFILRAQITKQFRPVFVPEPEAPNSYPPKVVDTHGNAGRSPMEIA